MEHDELKELLDGLHDRYNAPDFIADDPISVPHRFERREDIEISGFLAATIAWGNRKSIVRNAGRLMRLMDDAPYDFTVHASEQELNALLNFVHRTFNGADCIAFIRALRRLCSRYGSLGGYFEQTYAATAICARYCRGSARRSGKAIIRRAAKSTSPASTRARPANG